jgi:hypothetical protein
MVVWEGSGEEPSRQARGRGYCRRTIKIQQARGGVVVLQDNHHYRLGKDGGYSRKTPERLGQWSCMRTFMIHQCTVPSLPFQFPYPFLSPNFAPSIPFPLNSPSLFALLLLLSENVRRNRSEGKRKGKEREGKKGKWKWKGWESEEKVGRIVEEEKKEIKWKRMDMGRGGKVPGRAGDWNGKRRGRQR